MPKKQTKKMLKILTSLFFPNTCPECKIIICKDEVFCQKCLQKIKPIVSHFLSINQNYEMPVFALSAYKNPLKNLILKKSFNQSWASIKLAQIILQRLTITLKRLEIDYIVPIPLHWTRYASRGFNQSEIMAKVLSKKLGIPMLNALKRKKRTKYQSSLPVELRAENLKDAFCLKTYSKFRLKIFLKKSRPECKSKDTTFKKHDYLIILKNKNILLIDDLCTTGATLQNAAKVLVKFKPKSISSVVVSRVI